MSSSAPPPFRISRMAAVLLLVFSIASIVSLFVLPTLWLHHRYDSFLEENLDRLQRFRRIAALRPALEASIAEVLKQDGKKYYFHTAAPNLAAAELQNLATRIIGRHGGRVVSSQVQVHAEEGKIQEPQKVSVYVQFIASVVPLQLTLHSLETNVPYLFIEKVSIAARQGKAYRPQPGIQPDSDIHLSISAYVLPKEAVP
jgi:hypothetical protein